MKDSLYIGVDYHKRYSPMVVQDAQGKVLRSSQVMNGLACVKSFLDPFLDQETHAIVEARRKLVALT